jgi:hypothetical protein
MSSRQFYNSFVREMYSIVYKAVPLLLLEKKNKVEEFRYDASFKLLGKITFNLLLLSLINPHSPLL